MSSPFDIKVPLLVTTLLCFILLLLPQPSSSLPAAISLVDSTSRLFPYRTNFLQALRFKSRLARSPTRNVAAVLAAMAAEEAEAEPSSSSSSSSSSLSRSDEDGDLLRESSLSLYSLSDPMKKRTTTTTATTTENPKRPDGIEVEETSFDHSAPGTSAEIATTAFQCGIPSSRMLLNSLLVPGSVGGGGGRRGRIVGGEVVHHGEQPWMVSVADTDSSLLMKSKQNFERNEIVMIWQK